MENVEKNKPSPITEERQAAARQALKELMQRMIAAGERTDAEPAFRERVLKRIF